MEVRVGACHGSVAEGNCVAVVCLPKDLPEYIAVDLAPVTIGTTLHLADLDLPEGVQAAALVHGGDAAQAVAPEVRRGLARLIEAGYALLGLQTFFTAGPKEVRAWTARIGATAPQAAGMIHTDFQRGFIRAEVIGYDDYLAGRGEQGAKDAGKWRLEGKDYRICDGDVMHFRFKVCCTSPRLTKSQEPM